MVTSMARFPEPFDDLLFQELPERTFERTMEELAPILLKAASICQAMSCYRRFVPFRALSSRCRFAMAFRTKKQGVLRK